MNNTNDNNEVLAVVVNPLTGEIQDEIRSGDKIIHANPKYEQVKRKYTKKFKKEEAFVKVYQYGIEYLSYALDTKELAIATKLIRFINYNDGVLRDDNGYILDLITISEILYEPYDYFRQIVSKLIKKGIFAKTEIPSDNNKYKNQKCIVANPYIFFKGIDVENWAKNLFQPITEEDIIKNKKEFKTKMLVKSTKKKKSTEEITSVSESNAEVISSETLSKGTDNNEK